MNNLASTGIKPVLRVEREQAWMWISVGTAISTISSTIFSVASEVQPEVVAFRAAASLAVVFLVEGSRGGMQQLALQ